MVPCELSCPYEHAAWSIHNCLIVVLHFVGSLCRAHSRYVQFLVACRWWTRDWALSDISPIFFFVVFLEGGFFFFGHLLR